MTIFVFSSKPINYHTEKQEKKTLIVLLVEFNTYIEPHLVYELRNSKKSHSPSQKPLNSICLLENQNVLNKIL